MSDLMRDTVGLDYFAAALDVTPQAIANARRRAPDNFPGEVDKVAGSPRFDRRAADEWIDSRRRSRNRAVRNRPSSTPRLASPALGLSFLALVAAERRHGLDNRTSSEDVSRESLRARAAEAELVEEPLRGWLHDILGGPLSDADLADIAALNAALPPDDLQSFGESLVASKAVLRHTDTTPEALTKLILAAAGPAHRGVLDPAAGLGGLLLSAEGEPGLPRVGFEIDFRNVAAARSRAYLAGIEARFLHLDSLSDGRPWESVAQDIDVLVCDAPHFRRADDDDAPGKLSPNEIASAELEFALAAATALPADARGVIAVSAHALTNPAGAALRRQLVATRRLHRVVGIPSSAVPRYRFDLALLILGERMAPDSVVAFSDIGDADDDPKALTAALSGEPAPAADTLLDLLATPDVDLSPVLKVLAAGGDAPLSADDIDAATRGLSERMANLTRSAPRTVSGQEVVELLSGLTGARLDSLRDQGLVKLLPGLRIRGQVRPRALDEGIVRSDERAVLTLAALRERGPLAPNAAIEVEHLDRVTETAPGDVVFSRFGDSPARVDREGGHLVVSPATILRPTTWRLNPWMVEAALNSSAARRQMASTGAGRVDIDNLTLPLLPETGEVSEAADALSRLSSLRDDLDDLRNDLDRLVDELGEAIARSTLTHPEGSRPRWDAR